MLIMAASNKLSPTDVESVLKSKADDIGTAGRDDYFCYGRVNAAKAVQITASSAPSDMQPPSVAITSPGAGSTATGLVGVNVSATDTMEIAKVELYANGKRVGTETASPFGFSWDSTTTAR